MEEIWKDIKGYEGRYMVSDHGRVKSMNYRKQYSGEQILRDKNAKGYAKVDLPPKKSFLIHRLVASEFIGELNGLVVNHKDFNKKNNHVSNLEIVTIAGNNLHSLLDKKENGVYSSKLKGVSFFKNTGKWRAQKLIDGKKKHIGYFNTEQEAFNAM